MSFIFFIPLVDFIKQMFVITAFWLKPVQLQLVVLKYGDVRRDHLDKIRAVIDLFVLLECIIKISLLVGQDRVVAKASEFL